MNRRLVPIAGVLVLVLLALSVPTPTRAAITQTCPANWVRYLTGRGVLVCAKKDSSGNFNTFVQWIDLDSGARIRNAYAFDGSGGSSALPSPKFQIKLVSDWWTWSATGIASPPAGARFSAINGSFFKYFPFQSNTEVSHPLKDRGFLRSAGADANDLSKRVFGLYDGGSRAYMPEYTVVNSKDWTTVNSALSSFYDASVGFHPTRIGIDRDVRVPRTWVGIRDADGSGTFESVFILTTKGATQQETLDMLAVEFQTVLNTQFDGSGSAQMVIRGSSVVPSSDGRRVPHAFIVYEAP